MSRNPELAVRRYTPADESAVLDLLAASLGWVPDDQYAAFFRWKHFENPFGASPAWLALDGERIVGFRIFLRWEFVRDGGTVRAVRAVDTATHPDYQGRGIFRLLTMTALDELRAEGVAFVFNTPNDNSRPGYLKMGWQLVGVPSVRFRPRSVAALPRIARARVPAEKWSRPTAAGTPADGHCRELAAAAVEEPLAIQTNRTKAYLQWRYGFGPLAYRAEGSVIYRLRRRGRALEATISDILGGTGQTARVSESIRRVLRETRADYAVRLTAQPAGGGWLPLPGQGPTLVWRELNETHAPPLDKWRLSMGDLELF